MGIHVRRQAGIRWEQNISGLRTSQSLARESWPGDKETSRPGKNVCMYVCMYVRTYWKYEMPGKRGAGQWTEKRRERKKPCSCLNMHVRTSSPTVWYAFDNTAKRLSSFFLFLCATAFSRASRSLAELALSDGSGQLGLWLVLCTAISWRTGIFFSYCALDGWAVWFRVFFSPSEQSPQNEDSSALWNEVYRHRCWES